MTDHATVPSPITTGSVYPPFHPSWRDRLAHRLASVVLRIATPHYRALLRGAWLLGLHAAGAQSKELHK